MRGEVESASFRRDLKWIQAMGRSLKRFPQPPPCASAEPNTNQWKAEGVDPIGYSNTDPKTQEVCTTQEEEVLITKQLR